MSTPITMLTNPAHSATQVQTQKMEMAQNEIKALGQTKLNDAEKAAKLRETCESFESIFIQKMWQQMRATLPQENPLVGKEEKFWQSMYDQEFSKKMSQGGGIGLADMMYEQLSENLFNVSKTTAHASASGKGFEVQVAPMVPVGSAGHMASHSEQEDLLASKSATPAAENKTPSEQKFAALYEEVSPQNAQSSSGAAAVAQTGAVATSGALPTATPHAGQNSVAVQQFLAGLQAKQGVTTENSALTGPQRAQQVQQIVGSAPPAQGVLPPLQAEPQILRTTYTTNRPENKRQGDAESHMKALMAKAALQQSGQANTFATQAQGGSWQQASPSQQANSAVQEALRKAQEHVDNPAMAAAPLPLTPVNTGAANTNATAPLGLTPTNLNTLKRQS